MQGVDQIHHSLVGHGIDETLYGSRPERPVAQRGLGDEVEAECPINAEGPNLTQWQGRRVEIPQRPHTSDRLVDDPVPVAGRTQQGCVRRLDKPPRNRLYNRVPLMAGDDADLRCSWDTGARRRRSQVRNARNEGDH